MGYEQENNSNIENTTDNNNLYKITKSCLKNNVCIGNNITDKAYSNDNVFLDTNNTTDNDYSNDRQIFSAYST